MNLSHYIFTFTDRNIYIYIYIYIIIIIYITCRVERDYLLKMKKTLCSSSKAIRHRRRMINIHITFLSWALEVFAGLLVYIGTHILGHENNLVNFSLQTISHGVEFIILPSVLLINDTDFKTEIIESAWYNYILDIFQWQFTTSSEKESSTNDRSTSDGVSDGDESVDEHQEREPCEDNEEIDENPSFMVSSEHANRTHVKPRGKRYERSFVDPVHNMANDCELLDIEDSNGK